jgi:surface polysaccharide O-acyltransferase-like enzyme
MSVCAWLMLVHACARWRGRLVRGLANATLGVYLIHPRC